MGQSAGHRSDTEGHRPDTEGHRRIDERSLAMHHAIAAKLRAEPGLLAIARDNLNRWSEKPGHSGPYLEEWRRILDGPSEAMLTLMTQDSERMTALRQSSPFAGILTPAERWAIYARFASEPAEMDSRNVRTA